MKKLNLPRINQIIVSGRLTRDVDLRYTASGTPVANIGLANDRAYKDSDGNWQNDVSFFQVVAWRQRAERAAEQLKKGSPVLIEGRLKSRSWEDKDGNKRTSVEIYSRRIQRLEREYDPNKTYETTNEPEGKKEKSKKIEEDSEDEIPF